MAVYDYATTFTGSVSYTHLAGSFYMTELFRNYRLEEGPEIITEKIYTYRSSQTHGVYKSHCCYYAKLVGNKFDNPELLELSLIHILRT